MSADTPGSILHVDDDRAVRDGLAMLLRAEGYAVHSAANTKQALELISAGLRPDVLILDFHLEEQMNGAQLAEQICSILHHTPPIIVLTGDLSNAVVPRTNEAPVWMARKPLDPHRLLVALPGLILVSRANRQLDTQIGVREMRSVVSTAEAPPRNAHAEPEVRRVSFSASPWSLKFR